jgi:DNA-directed RNA polymerase specialized sigma subunit
MPRKKAVKKRTRKVAKKRAKVNPIDAALSSKEKLAAQRREEDYQLWQTWQRDPNQQNMHALMRRFEPVFRSKTNQFKAPNVNTSAFRGNLKLHAVKAFETYDPNRASLRTHLDNHLRKSMRFNAQHQNMAYIPEGQTAYIGGIDRARDELLESSGQEPSHTQIAQFVNQRPDLLGGKKRLTGRMVARVQGNRRKDVIGSTMEADPTAYSTSRNESVLGLLRPTLNQKQQQVFDHLYGMNGQPRIESTGALARKLGLSSSQVSRLKSGIATKYKKYI